MKPTVFFVCLFFAVNLSFAGQPEDNEESERNSYSITTTSSPVQEDDSYIKSLMSQIYALTTEVKNYIKNRGRSFDVVVPEPLEYYESLSPKLKSILPADSPEPSNTSINIGLGPPKLPKLPEQPPTTVLLVTDDIPSSEIDSKVQAMSQCFSDVQNILNDRERENLLAQGVSSENIACNSNNWPVNSQIWKTSYPLSSCYDRSQGGIPMGMVLGDQIWFLIPKRENRLS